MKLDFKINEEKLLHNAYELLDLDSKLWDEYEGAFGSVINEIMVLNKVINGEEVYEEDYYDALDSLIQGVSVPGISYDAKYISLPYLVKLFELESQTGSPEEQFQLILNLGPVIACDYKEPDAGIKEDIFNNYLSAKEAFAEMVKIFLMEYVDSLVEFGEEEKTWFMACVLAILDDPGAANAMMSLVFEEMYVICDGCGDCNEDIDSLLGEECEYIKVAKDVTGQWDGNDLSDTYLWISNFAQILGCNDVINALRHYYGTYTCPKCGQKMLVMDGVKRYLN